MNRLLNFLFGCRHRHYSWPQRSGKRGFLGDPRATKIDYVVCLDCGAEATYDMEEMVPIFWYRNH